MTDVEKLKKAIALAEWWASSTHTSRPSDMGVEEACALLAEAARSALPKMKTVEGEAWGVMDKHGKVVDVTLSGEIARTRASGWNDTYGSARPYTAFRLAGTAEIPA